MSSFCAVADLDPPTRAAMRALYANYFSDASEFDEDLSKKDWAVLLFDAGGSLAGFSTLVRMVHGESTVFFSGDTVVRVDQRSSWDLSTIWSQSIFRLVAGEVGPCYWFLICSGFRTYRFLPVFFREFYPRFDSTTPLAIRQLIDELGRACFGERYHDGVVRLQSACLEPLPVRRLDAHSRFFLEANPLWAQGHELACLTRLDQHNLTPAGQRMLCE
jgi:hypothetical protein